MSPELPLITPLLSLSHRLAAFPADSKVGHAGTIGRSFVLGAASYVG